MGSGEWGGQKLGRQTVLTKLFYEAHIGDFCHLGVLFLDLMHCGLMVTTLVFRKRKFWVCFLGKSGIP